jgi:hypothetical protein
MRLWEDWIMCSACVNQNGACGIFCELAGCKCAARPPRRLVLQAHGAGDIPGTRFMQPVLMHVCQSAGAEAGVH